MLLTFFTLPRPSRASRMAVAGLALAATALLALACRVPAFHAPVASVSGHGSYVQLHKPGQNQVMIQRKEGDPELTTISIQNAGQQSVNAMEIRGQGDAPYLDIGASKLLPEDLEPFRLLPAERLVCSMSRASADTAGMLNGFFLWQMPGDARQLEATFSRRVGWEIDPAGGLALLPRAGESLIEIPFDSPLPLDKIKVAWDVTPEDAPITAWFCVEGRSWGRVSTSGRRVSWTEPLDMSRDAKGQRRFMLRLAVESSSPLGLVQGQPITLNKLRIEREFQIKGRLLPMPPGPNELSVYFEAPAKPEPSLNVFLMATE